MPPFLKKLNKTPAIFILVNYLNDILTLIAFIPPSKPEPAPNGITGILFLLQSCNSLEICSTFSG